jgi:hypothetical protein
METGPRIVRAPRGSTCTCKGWPQEAALRMLMNNLDPDVAERPDDLVVYGGSGRAARSWAAFDAIVAALRRLDGDETLLVQSGQAGGDLPHARGRAARAHRQQPARARVGHVGDVPRPRAPRPHDVRADDGGQLDLHRHPGHPAGHLRDAGVGRGAPLRRLARGPRVRHRRPRRHGRRPAARGHDERRGVRSAWRWIRSASSGASRRATSTRPPTRSTRHSNA